MSPEPQSFGLLDRLRQEAAQGDASPDGPKPSDGWAGLAFSPGGVRLVAALTAFDCIVDCGWITPIPRTHRWLRGVANVRGSVYSVVDLPQFLGFSPVDADAAGKLLVVNDPGIGCALLVGEILGLRHFDPGTDRADVAELDSSVQAFASHAYRREDELWGVLDLDKLTGSDRFQSIVPA